MAAGAVTEVVARCRGCRRVRRSGARVPSARRQRCCSRPTEAANRQRSRTPVATRKYRPAASRGPSSERHAPSSHVRTRRDARAKHGLDAGPRRRQRTTLARWLARSGGPFPCSSTTAAGKPLRPRELTVRSPVPAARLARADSSAPRRRRPPSRQRTPLRGTPHVGSERRARAFHQSSVRTLRPVLLWKHLPAAFELYRPAARRRHWRSRARRPEKRPARRRSS